MRREPAGEVVAVLANGTSVTPLNDVKEAVGYTWVKVEVDGGTGWVADILIWEALEGYEILEETQDYYYEDGKFKGQLMKGTPYVVLERDGEWVKIRLLDGEEGYLWGSE
jgi:SH3-like domain-containing protein